MLILPNDHTDPGMICSIDPGTNSLGFCAMPFDLQTLDMHPLTAMTFRSDKMVEKDAVTNETHSERFTKILAQSDNLVRQFRAYRPGVICCESPFYGHMNPGAYGPLVEMVFAIKLAAFTYNPRVSFVMYAPTVIKQAIGVYQIEKIPDVKRTSKELVSIAMSRLTELQLMYARGLDQLDEHSLDAIAVAYTHLQLLRKAST